MPTVILDKASFAEPISGPAERIARHLILNFATCDVARVPDDESRLMSVPSAGHRSQAPWRVHLCDLSDPGIEVALEVHAEVVLGVCLEEGDEVDVNLWFFRGGELGVSRRHLMLHPTARSLMVIDLCSTNNSWLNGRAMEPAEPYPFSSGDVLSLSRLHLLAYSVQQVCPGMPAPTPFNKNFSAGLALQRL